jgi:hypothetical protein
MTQFFQKLLFASAGVALIAASSAHAAGTPEQRRACRKDAMRLCREFVPDVPKITACMEAHKAQLTPICRQQFK